LEYLDEEVPEMTEHGVTSQQAAHEQAPASDGHENAATEARTPASVVESHPFSMVAMFQRSSLVRPPPRTVQSTRRHALELSQVTEERVERRQLHHDEFTVSDTSDSTAEGLEDVELESLDAEEEQSSASVSV
jgi:hypothetical protein